MALTKRENRVINAFINCIKSGEYSEDYAITLIEDNARYGWMSNEAKEKFYELLDELHPEPESEPEQESEPESEPEETPVEDE